MIDYAELRDPETLAVAAAVAGPTLLALAVRLPVPGAEGFVRLIDNRVLGPAGRPSR
jgi:pantothenate synthetase